MGSYKCRGKVTVIEYDKGLLCQIASDVQWKDSNGKIINVWQDKDDGKKFIGIDDAIKAAKDMLPLLTLAREDDAEFEIEGDAPPYTLQKLSVGRSP